MKNIAQTGVDSKGMAKTKIARPASEIMPESRGSNDPESALESESQSAAEAALILGKHQQRSVAQQVGLVTLGKQIAKNH